MELSKESSLLIENYATVEEIFRCQVELDTELQTILFGLDQLCKDQAWWTQEWKFHAYRVDQVYITNTKWHLAGEGSALWLGVDKFNASHLFGLSPCPTLYLWVESSRGPALTKELLKLIEQDKLPGKEYADNGRGQFVIKRPLTRCSEDEAHRFPGGVLAEVVAFFSEYAANEETLSGAVSRTLGGSPSRG